MILLLGTALVVGSIYWIYLLRAAGEFRRHAIAEAETYGNRITIAVAQQFTSVVREVDFLLLDLRSEIALDGFDFREDALRSRDLFGPNGDFSAWVFDADGAPLASSEASLSDITIADRDYFRALRDDATDRLIITSPITGRHAGRTWILFVRPIERGGVFAGVILFALSPDYLSSRLAALGLGAHEQLAIRHRDDGSMIARSGPPGGSPAPDAEIIAHMGAGNGDAGVYTTSGPTEDAAVVAWRTIPGTPLVATFTQARADILATPDREIDQYIANNILVTVMFTALFGITGFLVLRDVEQRRRLHHADDRYRRLFDAVPDGMILVDETGRVTLWNQSALDLLGVDEDGLLNRGAALLDDQGRPLPATEFPTALANRQRDRSALHPVTRRDGNRRWLSFHSRRVMDEDETSLGAVISFTDVTRLVMLEDSMHISQSVFEAANEGIMVTGADRRIVSVNPAFTEITGYSPEEAVGRSPGELLRSGVHGPEFYHAMAASLDTKGHWEGEITNRRKNGQIFVEWLKISVVKDAEGKVLRYVALLSDITERKRMDQEIWRRANFDSLTGLPNRTLMMDRLGQAVPQARRRRDRAAVLFIDLDHFKPVNDTYGHRAGDDLLCQVARRISDTVRADDTVARIGGDEFVVVLPLAGEDLGVIELAERIRAALDRPFRISDRDVHISASIGIAATSGEQRDPQQVIKRADAAMYMAKSAGGNRIHSLL
ncbi:diguanylate cyclase [Zavarzinia compransoris]|uniref:bifunctional diguanylate cyclase/phosphodiesterase n=1 Tax=Zavarzinia marina TaxID=2911065 RepID=UPI001F1EC67B|nr:diguanylate cyclase [Zavarzinia marina]MCF4164177.1 diguanylate cyclase [Zavarzinia marina]